MREDRLDDATLDDPGHWVVVNGGALAWHDQLTGRRWTLDPDDVGDQLWTAAPDRTLAEAFVALVGLVRSAHSARATETAARAERDELRRLLDEAQLRSIEARNPGIDMDEVRRIRSARSSDQRTNDRTPEAVAELFHATYERLAPSFGYETRKASAVPWAEVPEQNRRLMIAVAAEVMAALSAASTEPAITQVLDPTNKGESRDDDTERGHRGGPRPVDGPILQGTQGPGLQRRERRDADGAGLRDRAPAAASIGLTDPSGASAIAGGGTEPTLCPGSGQRRVEGPGGYDPPGPEGMCPVCEEIVPLDDGICEDHPASGSAASTEPDHAPFPPEHLDFYYPPDRVLDEAVTVESNERWYAASGQSYLAERVLDVPPGSTVQIVLSGSAASAPTDEPTPSEQRSDAVNLRVLAAGIAASKPLADGWPEKLRDIAERLFERADGAEANGTSRPRRDRLDSTTVTQTQPHSFADVDDSSGGET